MHARVTDFFIYKWRYPLGYLFIAALLIMTVTITALSTPGGLRAGEVDSTVKSASLAVDVLEPSMVVNLPYHVLQRLGFMLFGVSTLTIKLPSIILGVFTIVGIFFLTRIWFRRNVAVLTTILAATSTQFLFLVQDGTPAIIFSFVTIWLLLSGTCITRNYAFNTFWKVVAGVLLACALYMPLGIYLVIAVVVTAMFHPHIRHIVKRISRMRFILAASLGLLFVTPLIYACIVNTATLFTLLGVDIGPDFSYKGHALSMWRAFFDFLTPSSNYILTPLFSISVVVLMTIGLYRVWRQWHTARSYVVLIIGIGLMPFLFINPSQVTNVFPIAVILMAYGIAMLITSWYRLFPRNPYARVAGLIPLTIIILGMMYSGVVRFTHNYVYNPEVVAHYSYDLRLMNATLGKMPKGTASVVLATPQESAFYNVVARYDDRFSVTTSVDATTPATSLIVTRAAQSWQKVDGTLTTIVTNGRTDAADRFYIYNTAKK